MTLYLFKAVSHPCFSFVSSYSIQPQKWGWFWLKRNQALHSPLIINTIPSIREMSHHQLGWQVRFKLSRKHHLPLKTDAVHARLHQSKGPYIGKWGLWSNLPFLPCCKWRTKDMLTIRQLAFKLAGQSPGAGCVDHAGPRLYLQIRNRPLKTWDPKWRSDNPQIQANRLLLYYEAKTNTIVTILASFLTLSHQTTRHK